MAKQSNELAREIQKTIERVAAQGFGGGEYQYRGRGRKPDTLGRKPDAPGLPKKQKPKKRVMKKHKTPMHKKRAGKMSFDNPADEVAYILERISEMIKEGDIQHIDLVAKKLRKAKKIGKGKYYFFDEEFEGGEMPYAGKLPKAKKPKRELSPKQKAWIKFVKKVHKENPNLSYKEALQLASKQRE